jgi:cholesterol transport system auxiliary component
MTGWGGRLAAVRPRGVLMLAVLVSAGLMSGLSGCGFNNSAPPSSLFDLGPAPVAQANLPQRAALAISFSAAQMLTDTGIIWRVGDSAAPHSYATYRWASSPQQLVQQRVVDLLSQEGPVLTDSIDPRAPVLQVTLTRFEQVYAPDGQSSEGQVVMQAVLLRERRTVDSVRLARSAPAPTQDANGGVLALRSATDAAAGELAAWLAQRMPDSNASAGNASTR